MWERKHLHCIKWSNLPYSLVALLASLWIICGSLELRTSNRLNNHIGKCKIDVAATSKSVDAEMLGAKRLASRSVKTSAMVTSIGTNTYLTQDQWPGQNTPSALDKILAADVAIGFTSIRFPIHWDWVACNADGTYDFTVYENAVRACVKYGLQPLIVVLSQNVAAPSSEWGGDNGFPTSLADMNSYANFVTAVAENLGPLVPSGLVIEIGNEPNHASNDVTKAAAYTTLFQLCRSRVSTRARLAGPAVSTWQDSSDAHVSSTVFTAECLRRGMKPDVLTAHLYNGIGSPSALMSLGQQFARLAGTTPLWITECGYPSGPPGNTNAVDPSTQASNLLYEVKNFPKFAAKVFVYEDRDEAWIQSSSTAPQEGYFGVMISPAESALKVSGRALKAYLHGVTSTEK